MTCAALSAPRLTFPRTAFQHGLDEHRTLLIIFVLQLFVSGVMCTEAHRPLLVGLGDAFLTIDGAVVIFGTMALAVSLIRTRPRGMPLRAAYSTAWRAIHGRVVSARWLASLAVLMIVLPMSLAVFSAAKRAIPSIEPFSWDVTLEHLSRELHGGRPAWEWLQPIVGRPAITIELDRYYHLGWSVLVLGTVGLSVISPISLLRRRFLTAWIALSFFCGTLAALAFSSAGPPYFARVTGEGDPYAALRVYLRSVDAWVPLLSVGGRRTLWAAYQRQVDAFGFGISAMPSMHIATTALVACVAWAVSPVLGVLAAGATVVMIVGSISLCWHYAIDGYAGALLAIAIWVSIGIVEKGRHAQPSCAVGAAQSRSGAKFLSYSTNNDS